MSDILISAEHVWKQYGLPLGRIVSDAMRRVAGRGPADPIWALRDVSFELRAGESLGIIGRNGAGKSTLLKVLAGVTPATRGQVTRNCRMFPMIELNAGVHVDLSGRENIDVLGAIMGLTRAQMRGKMPAIIEFSELGAAIDDPVRTYSSGMLARLGFSVAVHVDADVLLIDEVLSVGDLSFQKKCLTKLDQVRHQGTAVIFVSHSPYQVERTCDDAIMLEHGRIAHRGTPTDVLNHYFTRLVRQGSMQEVVLPDPASRPGSGDLRLTAVEFLGRDGDTLTRLDTGRAMTIRLHYHAERPIDMPNVKLRILDPYNSIVAGLNFLRFKTSSKISGDGCFECMVPALPLTANRYSVNIQVKGHLLLDEVSGVPLEVVSNEHVLIDTGSVGIVHIAADWSHRTDVSAPEAIAGPIDGSGERTAAPIVAGG